MADVRDLTADTAAECGDTVPSILLDQEINKPAAVTPTLTNPIHSSNGRVITGIDNADMGLASQSKNILAATISPVDLPQHNLGHDKGINNLALGSWENMNTSDKEGKAEAEPEGKYQEMTTRKRGDPVPGRCQHYLPRKRRYCRSLPQVGKAVCVEHLFETTEKKRIQCPLDPKHTCYESQLESHLNKCNARKEAQPVYYVENLNSGQIEDGEGTKVVVSTVEPDEIKDMVGKVNKLYEEHVGTLRTEILGHRVLLEEINKTSNGAAARKHLKQQASLVGHIEKQGLLHDYSCYIEFGAGKAGLSHWVQRALPSSEDTKFVLVDKSSVRYKMDSFHRGVNQGPEFDRLRIDIQHLDLNKVPSLVDNQRPLVGLGKHLCGGATDLMLRCLMQTVNETVCSSQPNPYVEGVVLALCCHHRCDWRSYVGKEAMRRWGVGPRHFSLMASMTSWATCATRTFLQKLKERESETGSIHQEEEQVDQPYNHPRYGSMTPEDREEVGFKCKKLIDLARVLYLREHGFTGELLLYADSAHTLENVVLVARNSKQQPSTAADSTAEKSSIA